MDKSKLKHFVYKYAIDNHDLVREAFSDYLDYFSVRKHYVQKIKKVIELNWKYRVLRKKSIDTDLRHLKFPEYLFCSQMSLQKLKDSLLRYDVISFDIFDTLIFRAVERPDNVFEILEAENGILGFAKARRDAERMARSQKDEVSLRDIYKILSVKFGLEIDSGVSKELETEMKICFANPYMKELYDWLVEKEKRIIAVSDMYLSEQMIRKLLEKCGYKKFEKVYVSSDYSFSKKDGKLQKMIKTELGENLKYVHLGDNQETDIEGSKSAGWDALYYRNVAELGHHYRRSEMKSLASAVYKGLVNSKLHSGYMNRDSYYELGYAYGGILASGYSQFLKKKAKELEIDQFIFLARDGYLLHQLWKKQDEDIKHDYIPFSRFAGYQITMERNWSQFIRHCVIPHIDSSPKECLRDIIEICDMPYLRKYFKDYELVETQLFDVNVVEKIEQIFEDHIKEILQYYEPMEWATAEYLKNVLGEHKRICVVDIGWQGSGANCLKYFLEKKCQLDVTIYGALLGASKSSSVNIAVSSGNLHSYLFSPQYCREVMNCFLGKETESKYCMLLMEILFTENAPSFLRYEKQEDDKILLRYGLPEHNEAILNSIQNGILDFCKDFWKLEQKFPAILNLSGYEAFMPIRSLMENKKYCLELLGDYEIDENSGFLKQSRKKKFKETQ